MLAAAAWAGAMVKTPLKASPKSKVSAKEHGAPELADVNEILARYRKAKSVQADVRKLVVQELMGTKNESEGKFYYARGKLRMDLSKPEKSTLVYDGKSVWLESRIDDKHVEVSHFKAGDLKKSDSVMAALFDKQGALNDFKLLKAAEAAGQKVFTMEPKDSSKTEVRLLEVAIKDQHIRRISYKDQMENLVRFEFSNMSQEKVPAERFTYKPPKGANVTEL